MSGIVQIVKDGLPNDSKNQPLSLILWKPTFKRLAECLMMHKYMANYMGATNASFDIIL